MKYCGEAAAAAVSSQLRGCQEDLRRGPLPESQLRPSVHGFKALVAFIEGGHVVARCASLKFVSRQEMVFRDLASRIATSASSSAAVSFDPVEWITEAVACGLIEDFDEMDYDIPRTLRSLEGSEWPTRQAIGLDPVPPGLLEQLAVMDAEEEKMREEEESADDFECLGCVPTEPAEEASRKRGLLSIDLTRGSCSWAKRPRRGGGEEHTRTWKYLSPAWVSIANCLFNHAKWRELAGLEALIAATADGEFNARAFMRRWLWLRWLGKKTAIEALLAPLFILQGEEEERENSTRINANGLKELSLCVDSVGV